MYSLVRLIIMHKIKSNHKHNLYIFFFFLAPIMSKTFWLISSIWSIHNWQSAVSQCFPVLAAFMFFLYWHLRRYRRIKTLKSMIWQVRFEEIDFVTALLTGSVRVLYKEAPHLICWLTKHNWLRHSQQLQEKIKESKDENMLFVCLWFFVPFTWRRNNYRWRAANFDWCSALVAPGHWGFFNVHTYYEMQLRL